jgi:hypothetical protein
VTSEEVDKLVAAASVGLRRQQGYVNTTVHSYEPVVLAHCFKNQLDSHAFALYLAPKNNRYSINPDDPCTVLERRTVVTLTCT